jgi:hypothetical protein
LICSSVSYAAYPTTIEHHKLYPYTSLMASPYSGDSTGSVDCAAALESIKADQSNLGTIYVPRGTYKVSTNVTIPIGMRLEFAAGAVFSIDAGKTMTIQCPVVSYGTENHFSGSGAVSIGTTFSASNVEINPPISTISVTSNTTIPSNVSLNIKRGTTFVVSTGITLTINGGLDAGRYQIFSCSGTGKVVFGAGVVKEVYPEWWGTNTAPGTTDMAAAIQAAVTAADAVAYIDLSSTTYLVKTAITTGTRPLIRGKGEEVTILKAGAAIASILAVAPNAWYYDIEGIRFDGNSLATNGLLVGSTAAGNGMGTLSHLYAKNSGYGINIIWGSQITLDCVYAQLNTTAGIRVGYKSQLVGGNIWCYDNKIDLLVNGDGAGGNPSFNCTFWGLFGNSVAGTETEFIKITDTCYNIEVGGQLEPQTSPTAARCVYLESAKSCIVNNLAIYYGNETVVANGVRTYHLIQIGADSGSIYSQYNKVTNCKFFSQTGDKLDTTFYEVYLVRSTGTQISGCSGYSSDYSSTGVKIGETAQAQYTNYEPTGSKDNAWAVTVSTSFTPVVHNKTVYGDATAGSIVLKVPLASSSTGARVRFIKSDVSANTVTIQQATADTATINPGANVSIALRNQFESVTLDCDGLQWTIVEWASQGIGTLADSATPSVAAGSKFLTGGTTAITDITGGYTGKIITIVSEHTITITNGTNMFLLGAANFDMSATDTLTLIQKVDGNWYELARSVN